MGNTWQSFDNSLVGLRFKYPTETPQGHLVALDEYKVHFQSLGSAELYFEITRYLKTSVHDSYEREKVFVQERLNASVSGLTETVFKDYPAFKYSITWQEEVKKERQVFLISKGEWLYRIIYDPNAPLNKGVLDSLELSHTEA